MSPSETRILQIKFNINMNVIKRLYSNTEYTQNDIKECIEIQADKMNLSSELKNDFENFVLSNF